MERTITSATEAHSKRVATLVCGHRISDNIGEPGDTVDCVDCDDRRRPTDFSLGRSTPVFTAKSVPSALLKNHRAGTWAELVVTEGSVDFTQNEPPWAATAVPENAVSIVPGPNHSILPSDDAIFRVQFFDAPKPADS